MLTQLWDLLDVNSKEEIKTQGLFNFLCYLQTFDSMVDHSDNHPNPIALGDRTVFNFYGYTIDGVFFVKPNSQKLFEDFFDLRSNKKEFDRSEKKDIKKFKTIQEMEKDMTYNPQLAPRTSAYVSTKRDLTQRDRQKLEKI